jgi:hypothetical protein
LNGLRALDEEGNRRDAGQNIWWQKREAAGAEAVERQR